MVLFLLSLPKPVMWFFLELNFDRVSGRRHCPMTLCFWVISICVRRLVRGWKTCVNHEAVEERLHELYLNRKLRSVWRLYCGAAVKRLRFIVPSNRRCIVPFS